MIRPSYEHYECTLLALFLRCAPHPSTLYSNLADLRVSSPSSLRPHPTILAASYHSAGYSLSSLDHAPAGPTPPCRPPRRLAPYGRSAPLPRCTRACSPTTLLCLKYRQPFALLLMRHYLPRAHPPRLLSLVLFSISTWRRARLEGWGRNCLLVLRGRPLHHAHRHQLPHAWPANGLLGM